MDRSNRHGYWVNTGLDGQPVGYTCVLHHYEPPPRLLAWVLRQKPIYEFRLSRHNPLTWVDEVGNAWQSDRHYFTDKGSIPPALHWMIDPDETLAFYPHDSGYHLRGAYLRPASRDEALKYGWAPDSSQERQWVSGDDKMRKYVRFAFVKLTREQIDWQLYCGYLAQWGDGVMCRSKARKILLGVRAGGVIPWYAQRERNKNA